MAPGFRVRPGKDTPSGGDKVNPTRRLSSPAVAAGHRLVPMLVKQGDRTLVDAPADAEPGDDAIWRDYYSVLPSIRLTADAANAPEVVVDSNDILRLIECALRHSNVNMRQSVLSAIRGHPESFRQIFEFGLNAPEAFGDIRKIVAEALTKRSVTPAPGAAGGKTLLPPLPLPPHLRRS